VGLAVRALTGLMKRLSKTNDIVFCGRVLMTLSRIMPLLDPSGINPKGLINRSNITTFQSQESETESDSMNIDQDIRPSSELSEVPIDYQFHHQFWSMMQYLQDPEKALPDNNWESLCNYIRQVLRAFSNITTLQNEECAEIVSSEAYFTKYLTSQKLIQLEAQDPYFRRHVLIQLLVFYQALRKSSVKNVEVNLSENKKATLDDFEKKTKNILEKTSAHGKKLANTVAHILKREENWISWKREGCTSFERFSTPKNMKRPQPSPEPLTTEIPEDDNSRSKKQKITLGNEILDKLWNPSLTLEDFSGPPTLQEVLGPAIEELHNPDEGDPEIPKLVTGKTFQWKSYRMIMRNNFDFIIEISFFTILAPYPKWNIPSVL